jgi:hypothetical protein
MFKFMMSKKGDELIGLYADMAINGYQRTDGKVVENSFSDFEARPYRDHLKKIFEQFSIRSVLDYGCGGSDWNQKGFDPASGMSAVEFFNLDVARHFEPARAIDERIKSDCVISFDVLEHVFISDIPNTIRQIFSLADKLVVVNVACYPAAAKLPNGENAHITVRKPDWWKGIFDAISLEFPSVQYQLIASPGYRTSQAYPVIKANDWDQSPTFVVN